MLVAFLDTSTAVELAAPGLVGQTELAAPVGLQFPIVLPLTATAPDLEMET